MHTVLTQNAELPIERWLGFFVGENEKKMKLVTLLNAIPLFSRHIFGLRFRDI